MKRLNTLILVVALLLVASVSQAQTIVNNTTLNGAITSVGANSFVLTSASAITGATAPAVGHCLYVERELMQITAISSTRVTVIRGTGGTSAALHPTGAVVFTGACGNFRNADPVGTSPQASLKACTTATMGVRPFVNTANGNIWLCKSSVWTATNAMVITYNSVDPY